MIVNIQPIYYAPFSANDAITTVEIGWMFFMEGGMDGEEVISIKEVSVRHGNAALSLKVDLNTGMYTVGVIEADGVKYFEIGYNELIWMIKALGLVIS